VTAIDGTEGEVWRGMVLYLAHKSHGVLTSYGLSLIHVKVSPKKRKKK
jgi:hypothetical protein